MTLIKFLKLKGNPLIHTDRLELYEKVCFHIMSALPSDLAKLVHAKAYNEIKLEDAHNFYSNLTYWNKKFEILIDTTVTSIFAAGGARFLELSKEVLELIGVKKSVLEGLLITSIGSNSLLQVSKEEAEILLDTLLPYTRVYFEALFTPDKLAALGYINAVDSGVITDNRVQKVIDTFKTRLDYLQMEVKR